MQVGIWFSTVGSVSIKNSFCNLLRLFPVFSIVLTKLFETLVAVLLDESLKFLKEMFHYKFHEVHVDSRSSIAPF